MKDARAAGPASPAPAGRVEWHPNTSIGPAKRGAALSLAMSLAILGLGFASVLGGDTSIFTLLLVFVSFYFIDTAVTRLRAALRAPTDIGLGADGVIVRTRRGDEFLAWGQVRDVRAATVGGRVDLLHIDTDTGRTQSFKGVPRSLTMEVKLAWFAHATRREGAKERAAAAEAARPGAFPADLEPTAAPQYWDPVRTSPSAMAGAQAKAPPSVLPPPAAWSGPAGRPAWSYTRVGSTSQADPRYPAQPASVPAFTWHFIPPSGTRVGGVFLVAVLILAGIAISRLAADLLLSFAGLPSDPWIATAIGLGIGAGLAVGAWRVARDEIAGEVAGSVIFLPTFDRTKAELLSTLRQTAADLGAGQPRERQRRARSVLVWPHARTRAIVMQASYDTRAIVLKTVGRSNYSLHAEFKSAILDRLRANGPRR